ncbi:unnamed protein product [Mytilus edulis]|uniref:Uncharacterized protein n=1 Tax=Mytilus edulis TaxID=6550 RepID=A0A8S3T696_MYTED|nr:unnamed protein product [Mytilus edulis]
MNGTDSCRKQYGSCTVDDEKLIAAFQSFGDKKLLNSLIHGKSSRNAGCNAVGATCGAAGNSDIPAISVEDYEAQNHYHNVDLFKSINALLNNTLDLSSIPGMNIQQEQQNMIRRSFNRQGIDENEEYACGSAKAVVNVLGRNNYHLRSSTNCGFKYKVKDLTVSRLIFDCYNLIRFGV